MKETTMNVSAIYAAVVRLHEALKLPPMTDMPDRIWSYRLSDYWAFVLNGTPSMLVLEDGELHGRVEPYGVTVWGGGWLAGMFTPDGGIMVGASGTEDQLLAAFEAEIQRVNDLHNALYVVPKRGRT